MNHSSARINSGLSINEEKSKAMRRAYRLTRSGPFAPTLEGSALALMPTASKWNVKRAKAKARRPSAVSISASDAGNTVSKNGGNRRASLSTSLSNSLNSGSGEVSGPSKAKATACKKGGMKSVGQVSEVNQAKVTNKGCQVDESTDGGPASTSSSAALSLTSLSTEPSQPHSRGESTPTHSQQTSLDLTLSPPLHLTATAPPLGEPSHGRRSLMSPSSETFNQPHLTAADLIHRTYLSPDQVDPPLTSLTSASQLTARSSSTSLTHRGCATYRSIPATSAPFSMYHVEDNNSITAADLIHRTYLNEPLWASTRAQDNSITVRRVRRPSISHPVPEKLSASDLIRQSYATPAPPRVTPTNSLPLTDSPHSAVTDSPHSTYPLGCEEGLCTHCGGEAQSTSGDLPVGLGDVPVPLAGTGTPAPSGLTLTALSSRSSQALGETGESVISLRLCTCGGLASEGERTTEVMALARALRGVSLSEVEDGQDESGDHIKAKKDVPALKKKGEAHTKKNNLPHRGSLTGSAPGSRPPPSISNTSQPRRDSVAGACDKRVPPRGKASEVGPSCQGGGECAPNKCHTHRGCEGKRQGMGAASGSRFISVGMSTGGMRRIAVPCKPAERRE